MSTRTIAADETINAGRVHFLLPPDIASRLSAPGTKAGQMQRIVLALLQEHDNDGSIPTSGRFVFYELEQRGLARKSAHDDTRPNKRRERGWPPGTQDYTDALMDLRKRRVVPWSWIEDETCRLAIPPSAATVAAYLADRLGEATINPWGAEPPPLIMCESRATAGVLRRVVAPYACPITGTGGQAGGFLRTGVAPILQDDARRVLYLGDLDKSGNDIEANARRVLERETG